MSEADAPQHNHIRTYAQDLAAARKARGRQKPAKGASVTESASGATPKAEAHLTADAGSKAATPTRSVSGHRMQAGKKTETPASEEKTTASKSTPITAKKLPTAATPAQKKQSATPSPHATPPPIPQTTPEQAPTTHIPAFHEIDQAKDKPDTTSATPTDTHTSDKPPKKPAPTDKTQTVRPDSPSLWARLRRWFTGRTGTTSSSAPADASVTVDDSRKAVIQQATSKTGTQFTADSHQLKESVRTRQQTTPPRAPARVDEANDPESDLKWSPYTESGYPLLEADTEAAPTTTVSNVRVTPKRISQATAASTRMPSSPRSPESPRWESEVTAPAAAPSPDQPTPPPAPEPWQGDTHEQRWGDVATTAKTPQSVTPPTPPRPQPPRTQSPAPTLTQTPPTPPPTTKSEPSTPPPARERVSWWTAFKRWWQRSDTETVPTPADTPVDTLTTGTVTTATPPPQGQGADSNKPATATEVKSTPTPQTSAPPPSDQTPPETPSTTATSSAPTPQPTPPSTDTIEAPQAEQPPRSPSPSASAAPPTGTDRAPLPPPPEEVDQVPTPATIATTQLTPEAAPWSPPEDNDTPALQLTTLTTSLRQFVEKVRALDTNALTLALLIVCTAIFVVVVSGRTAWDTLQGSGPDTTTNPTETNVLIDTTVESLKLPGTRPAEGLRRASQDVAGLTEFVIVNEQNEPIPAVQVLDELEFNPGSPVTQSIQEVRLISNQAGSPLIWLEFVDIDTMRGGFFAWETSMVGELARFYGFSQGTVTFSDAVVAGVDVRVARVNGETRLLYGFLDENTLLIAPDTTSFASIATHGRAE